MTPANAERRWLEFFMLTYNWLVSGAMLETGARFRRYDPLALRFEEFARVDLKERPSERPRFLTRIVKKEG